MHLISEMLQTIKVSGLFMSRLWSARRSPSTNAERSTSKQCRACRGKVILVLVQCGRPYGMMVLAVYLRVNRRVQESRNEF